LLLVLSHILRDLALNGRLQRLAGTFTNQVIEILQAAVVSPFGTGSAITLSCPMTHPFLAR
jgi:hypothetical protein